MYKAADFQEFLAGKILDLFYSREAGDILPPETKKGHH